MLKGHTDCVWCVATCTAGGRVLAVSGSDDKTLRVWDVEAGTLRTVLKGHTATVYGVATCTVGGRVLAVSGGDKTLRIWGVGSVAHDETIEELIATPVRPAV